VFGTLLARRHFFHRVRNNTPEPVLLAGSAGGYSLQGIADDIAE
jgi:hypothetical protein